MKRSLTIFGVILLVQGILSAPANIEEPINVEEPVDVDPELRGILDSIVAAVARPILNGLGIVGLGVVDPGTLISSAMNGIAGTGGSLVNNPYGPQNSFGAQNPYGPQNPYGSQNPLGSLNPLGPRNPVHNTQQDEEIYDAVKALVDEINSESPNVSTDTIENDPMTLLDAFLKNEDDEEETPLYLVVV